MEINLSDQFTFDWPDNLADYLVRDTNLESFKYYPLLVAVLLIVLALMVASFFYAKLKRGNRAVSKFCKGFGKAMLIEFLIGAFVLFARWQTLGIFALRVFLVTWLLSLPIVVIVYGILYFLKVQEAKEVESKEKDLDKYKPSRR